ncbi:hypothetical protein DL766_003719 [Monosporascus sp. MC13-8B]|uniref:Uncharacterized protein n=1 Tax=Monosporascus cannonballus TaxID=155416 RepID=A0ABY0H3F3_9PEZI|nr:hypothetical protein DL762_006107 [Monosporascus cannonballus]RYO88269.1 hypothetical protein DL763_006056 [Monosporascus cannonballus]RYP32995.1 hypothetical protein DL766_003719 [Monosporascus sp. MC13-8B]
MQPFLAISLTVTKDKLADFVRRCERLPGEGPKYHVNIMHAEDDYDIPWTHSEQVLWHAVNASTPGGIIFGELEKKKAASRSSVALAVGW